MAHPKIRLIASSVAVLASGSAFALPVAETTIMALAVLDDNTKIIARFERDIAEKFGLMVANGHGYTEKFVSAGTEIFENGHSALALVCGREIIEEDIVEALDVDTETASNILADLQIAELKTLIDFRMVEDSLCVVGLGPDAAPVVNRFGLMEPADVLSRFYGIEPISGSESQSAGETEAARVPAE